ncbi:MmgE/PrpD family protein [Bordetella tumulicola]|uniref:MmgE/PrpD family protein n=1 Tax=Bordetella tumulicola TaxID=1649133 RepID=UPI0039EF5875
MITRSLAAWLANLSRDQIPGSVHKELRHLALDTFSVGLRGRHTPWSEAIRDWATQDSHLPHGASLWGENGLRLRPSDAALVNGTAAHSLELDDFHNAKVHPGAVIVPTVFAVAEHYGVDPARLDIALAAGYEVMIRTSLALSPAETRLRGWHLTPVCGPLGAAAATAVMLELQPHQIQSALGLAATQSSGLFAFTLDGADSKRLHAGMAARAGVVSAELARKGVTGPAYAIEAEDGGMMKAFSDHSDASRMLHALGDTWHAAKTNFKPYSCCGSAHANVDAAIELRAEWPQNGPVRVGVPTLVDIQCGYQYEPGSELQAQMSVRYAVASALLHGSVLPQDFEAARRHDPAMVRLANAIEIVRDTDLDQRYPKDFCGWVEIIDRSGVPRKVLNMNPSGSADNAERHKRLREKSSLLLNQDCGPEASEEICDLFLKPAQLDIQRIIATSV